VALLQRFQFLDFVRKLKLFIDNRPHPTIHWNWDGLGRLALSAAGMAVSPWEAR